ncbi:MAG: hypothetical protein ATN35_03125 [Epulopiscium sp. Nele67-Bin004]|nr:MAG: hypothetical protein ATN35_03125 [Epulopiscium sp. Nele67-Bin004]
MKKLAAFMMAMITAATATINVYALEGEMGYFGGITPGTKIPTGIAMAQEKFEREKSYTLEYAENIYLSGEAIPVYGTLEIRPGEVNPDNPTGEYTETYIVKAASADGRSEIARTLTLRTMYLYNEAVGQITKTSTVTRWVETVVVNGMTYYLDSNKSSFSKSILEDLTPGVMYYSGDVYYKAVYNDVTGGGSDVVINVDSRVYGYDQAFAKSETQVRNVAIDTGSNQYFIQETPTITMNKELSYASNDPFAISFAGNYKEMISGSGALQYNILLGDAQLFDDEKTGVIGVFDVPTIEQLALPTLDQLLAHPAKADIEKMYSMEIFDVNPLVFSPNQVVTRGEYIKMIVKALRIPLPEINAKTNVSPFNDLDIDSALYPYVLAAYDAGLISGGTVSPSTYLTMQEMIVFNVRAIGLERLGFGIGVGQTPYLDDNSIADYAKSAVYAASQIGIIPSTNGYIFPTKVITYADCAAMMNQLIDYLRYDLQKDYNQHMMM